MPTVPSPINAQRIASALASQSSLYLQLLELARRQTAHVAAGETEPLMTILAARSRLIEQIVPLDRALQPYKGRWQEVLDSLPATDRATVASLLKKVQQLLADILDQDERDKESLLKQKTDIGSQIQKTVTGAALNRAYGVARR